MGKQKSIPNKITSAFKTDPKFKLIIDVLAYNSNKKNVSAYLNYVVRTGINAGAEIAELKRKLATYESDAIKSIYKMGKGREARFLKENGDQYVVKVEKIEDVQKVFLETYRAFKLMVKKFGYDYSSTTPAEMFVATPPPSLTASYLKVSNTARQAK